MASAWETISNNRRREPRYRIRLTASVSIVEGVEANQWATVLAYTRDISREGLCLIMPSSRMGCHNLEEANHVLQIRLVLPNGVGLKLESQLVYCITSASESEVGYLAGVKITEFGPDDHTIYNDFIDGLYKD
jgi:PilZ domain